jgi:hypothetical protein
VQFTGHLTDILTKLTISFNVRHSLQLQPSRNSFQFRVATFVSLTPGLRELNFGSVNMVSVEPSKEPKRQKILERVMHQRSGNKSAPF